MSKLKGWTLQGSLLRLWMNENVSQQSNKKLLTMENLQIFGDATTKLSQIVPTRVIENRGAQQVKYVGNTDVFIFGFNFLSPKWTRTKLIFVVTPPQQA